MTASAGTVTAALADVAVEDVSVSFPDRTITGTVLRYGMPANTSAGRIVVYPGDVEWSAPERVAFIREHVRAGASLGHATAVWDDGDQLRASFRVALGPDGDRALYEAASGIRTGLSFGLDILANLGRVGDATRVRGQMREVSHVVVPAWDDARITALATLGEPSVTAPAPAAPPAQPSYAPPVGASMFPAAGFAAAAHAPAAPAQVAPTPAQPAPAGSWQWQPAPAPVYPVGPVQSPTDHLVAGLRDQFAQMLDEVRRGVGAPPVAVPGIAPEPAAPAGGESPELGLQAFASLAAKVATGQAHAGELTAALADVIPADSPSAFRPQYLNELWEGTTTARKFIDNATVTRPLTSMKIVGQRWQVAPTVGDYAGDKTEVPTNEPVLVDIPVTAKRIAGAHDVDRAYVDLGSPEWFASYFEAQSESYRVKSDRAAALLAYTEAPLLDAAVPDLLAGVISCVVDLAGTGKDVSYVAMAPGLVSALFGITRDEAPAFFSGSFSLRGAGDGGLGDVKWFTTPGLGTNQVLVGTPEATRYHEVSPPIRIQAQNVAHGGIDLGVFGYYAAYVRDHSAIRKFVVGQADPA